MIGLNAYDIDIARENAVAIRAEIDHNVLARTLRAEGARGGWLVRRIDPFLVRIGERATARMVNRQDQGSRRLPPGAQPQGH